MITIIFGSGVLHKDSSCNLLVIARKYMYVNSGGFSSHLKNCGNVVRCKVFTTVKILMMVSWITILCSLVGDYQHCTGTCCFYLQDRKGVDTDYIVPCPWRQQTKTDKLSLTLDMLMTWYFAIHTHILSTVITVRLAFPTQSLCMRPNCQGSLWLSFMGVIKQTVNMIFAEFVIWKIGRDFYFSHRALNFVQLLLHTMNVARITLA
jgi:hypothetical protein